MNFGGYDAFDDPYAYKGTTVLKNKLGLRDPELLEAFELEMTTLRANEPLPSGMFDPAHYRRVHRHLFQDVYSWAGKDRTVRTSKDGNPFCFPEYIKNQMNNLFAALHAGPCFQTNQANEFVTAVAHFLGELNAIHPFREGNGRAQLSFISLIGAQCGFPFDFTKVERATFMPAMIASYDQNFGPLVAELTCLLDND